MAGRRSSAAPVRRRRRSVRGWPAPGNRRRCAGGCRGQGSGSGRRVLRRAAAGRGAVPDDSHRRRLLDHARPPRIDRGSHRDCDRRRRGRGHGRPERRRRVGRAVRPPRHSPDRRSARVRRPALAAPCADRSASASVGGAAAASECACASAAQCGSPGREAAAIGDSCPRCAAQEGACANACGGAAPADAQTGNTSRRDTRPHANCTALDAARTADLGPLALRQAPRREASVCSSSRRSRAPAACSGDGPRPA